jgi:hypothetical protein
MRSQSLFLAGVLSIAVSSPTLAEDCPLYLGQWGDGPIRAAEVEGDLGLVASGAVLQVVDVSHPLTLEVLGELTLPGVIEGMAHTGTGWAVVAAGTGGLWMVDVSDPADPVGRRVNLGGMKGPVVAVAAAGNHAFAVDQTGDELDADFRFWVLDITVPATPELLGAVSDAGAVEDIAIGDRAVYLALWGNRLVEIDVSDPHDPVLQSTDPGSPDQRGYPVRVEVCDGTVYFVAHEGGGWFGLSYLFAITPHTLALKWFEGWQYGYAGGVVQDIECSGEHLLLAETYGLTSFDVSSPDPSRLFTRWVFPDYGKDLEVAGNLGFLADFNSTLRVFDASDPTGLADLGLAVLPGLPPASDLATTGHHVVGAGDRLTVFDVEDPNRPQLVATATTLGFGSSVAAADKHAYVAVQDRGVEVFDLTSPDVPVSLGAFSTEGDAVHVVLHESHLLVVSDLLEVFDVSHPTSPIRIATLNATGRPHLTGDLLLLGAVDGLIVIDVSNPRSPTQIGRLDGWRLPAELVTGITTTDDLAYVATWSSPADPIVVDAHLHVVDIADPRTPSLLETRDLELPALSLLSRDDRLIAALMDPLSPEDCAFNTAACTIVSFDLSDPVRPHPTSVLRPRVPHENPWSGKKRAGVHGLVETDSIAFASLASDLSHSSFAVIDLTDPAEPKLGGTLLSPLELSGVAIDADIAIVTEFARTSSNGAGLLVFDVTEPRAPVELAFIDIPSEDDQVAISGSVAYVAGTSGDVHIIDLTDPSRPREVDSIDPIDFTCEALTLDHEVLLVWGIRGLRVFDLADPFHPIQIGMLDSERGFHEADSANGIAVALSTAGNVSTRISTLDVTDPARPREIVFSLTRPGDATSVTVVDGYAYVTTDDDFLREDDDGFFIIDVSVLHLPAVVADIRTLNDARDVTVSDGLAYVANGPAGVVVYDVSNPAAPVEIHRITTPGNARAVAVDGETLFVADGDGGMTTFTDRPCPVGDPGLAPSTVD